MPLGVLGCWTPARAGRRLWIAQLACGRLEVADGKSYLTGIREERRTTARSCGWRKEGRAMKKERNLAGIHGS